MAATEVGIRLSVSGVQQAQSQLDQVARGLDGLGTHAQGAAGATAAAGARMQTATRGVGVAADEAGRSLGDMGGRAQGSADAIVAAGARAQAATRGLGVAAEMSAKQTQAALRGIPAQFTDIVTSLTSGQSPLMVLMQQGGQLKDMFGGIGPAARALGGYVAGLANPFTVAGAAAAALGYAAYQGSLEADQFRASLLMTGNAAGTSVAQMQDMAAAMDAGFGQTTAKSAEALAAMAATGQVASGNLSGFAQTAIDMEQSFGQSMDTTAKHFAELGKDPVGASMRLNDSLNYLTASTYEQIAAAKALGDEERAASLAQDAYAKAMNARAATVVENLGWMERSWRAVAGVAKETWDAMLGLGRATTGGEQLAKLQGQLAQRQAMAGTNLGAGAAYNTQEMTRLKEQIGYLQETERMQRRAADATAQRAAAEKAAITATDAVTKANERAQTKQEQLNKSLKDYRDNLAAIRRVNPNSSALDPAQIAKTEASIRDQYKANGSGRPRTSAAQSEAERQARAYQELTASIQAKIDATGQELAQGKALTAAQKQAIEIERLVSTGKISAKDAASEKTRAMLQELTTAEASAVASKELQKVEEERAKAEAARIKQYTDSAASAAQRLQGLQEEAKAMAYAEQYQVSMAVAVEQTAIARLREQQAMEMAKGGNAAVIQALRDEIAAREQIVQAISSKEVREAADQLRKDELAEWDRTWGQVAQSFTDALMQGGQSVKGYLKNLFRTLVLRPILDPIGKGFAALLGGGGSAAAMAGEVGGAAPGGISGLLGQVGSLGSLASAFGTGAAASFTSMVSAGVGGWATAAGSLIGSGSAAGMAAGLGMVAAPLAALAGLYSLISGKKPPGEQHTGGFYSSRGLTGDMEAAQRITGGDAGMARDLIKRANPQIEGSVKHVVSGVLQSAASRAKALGVSGAYGIDAGFAANTNGKAGNKNAFGYFNIMDKSGTVVAEYMNRELGPDIEKASQKWAGDMSEKMAELTLRSLASKDLKAELQSTARSAERAATLMGRARAAANSYVQATFGPSDEAVSAYLAKFQRYGETFDQALSRLSGSLTAVNRTLDTLGHTLLQTSLAGADAASKLIDAFGGAEQFTGATSAYFQSYYTEAERVGITTRQLTEQLGTMGLTMPATHAEFRKFVEAQDRTTESGRTAYASLLQLAPAFDQVAQAAQAAREKIAQERDGLQRQMDELMGNTAALRDRERNALDESNRELYDQIKAIEARREVEEHARQQQQAAAEAAAQAAENAAQAERQRADAMAAATRTVQEEILRLRGLTHGETSNVAYLQAQFATASAQARAGDTDALGRLSELSKSLEAASLAGANSEFEQARIRGQLAGSLAQTLRILKQEVPEVNPMKAAMTGLLTAGQPGAVQEAPDLARALIPSGPAFAAPSAGGGDAAEEIRLLRAENAAQARAMVQMQLRMTRLLERWEGAGMPEQRAQEIAS